MIEPGRDNRYRGFHARLGLSGRSGAHLQLGIPLKGAPPRLRGYLHSVLCLCLEANNLLLLHEDISFAPNLTLGLGNCGACYEIADRHLTCQMG